MTKLKAYWSSLLTWADTHRVEACIIASLVIVFVLGAFAGRVF